MLLEDINYLHGQIIKEIRTPTPSGTKSLILLFFMAYIREVAGNRQTELKTPVRNSTEWAGLEQAGVKTVAEFLDNFSITDGSTCGEYLFDWSLPINAPKEGVHLVYQ